MDVLLVSTGTVDGETARFVDEMVVADAHNLKQLLESGAEEHIRLLDVEDRAMRRKKVCFKRTFWRQK